MASVNNLDQFLLRLFLAMECDVWESKWKWKKTDEQQIIGSFGDYCVADCDWASKYVIVVFFSYWMIDVTVHNLSSWNIVWNLPEWLWVVSNHAQVYQGNIFGTHRRIMSFRSSSWSIHLLQAELQVFDSYDMLRYWWNRLWLVSICKEGIYQWIKWPCIWSEV